MNELGKVAGMEIEIAKPDGDSQMTIDLSNRTIGAAIGAIGRKAIGAQAAPGNPVAFSLILQGNVKKVMVLVNPPKKPQ